MLRCFLGKICSHNIYTSWGTGDLDLFPTPHPEKYSVPVVFVQNMFKRVFRETQSKKRMALWSG